MMLLLLAPVKGRLNGQFACFWQMHGMLSEDLQEESAVRPLNRLFCTQKQPEPYTLHCHTDKLRYAEQSSSDAC